VNCGVRVAGVSNVNCFCAVYSERIMTRWARGVGANRKKPLDATEWTEMKFDSTNMLTDNGSASQKKGKFTKQSLSKKSKSKSDSKQKHEVPSDRRQQNVADDLEKLGKESALVGKSLESVFLEEFVHKNARREARRLKRQEQKRQSRVCDVEYLFE